MRQTHTEVPNLRLAKMKQDLSKSAFHITGNYYKCLCFIPTPVRGQLHFDVGFPNHKSKGLFSSLLAHETVLNTVYGNEIVRLRRLFMISWCARCQAKFQTSAKRLTYRCLSLILLLRIKVSSLAIAFFLCVVLTSRVALLRWLAGSGWSAGATTLRIVPQRIVPLVHSTAEYCVPVCRRSAHTLLNHPAINETLRIVTGCLRPTPTDNLPILAGIQPAELHRSGANYL